MEEIILILFVIFSIIILISFIIYAIYLGIKYIIESIKYSKNEKKASELNELALSQMKKELEIYDNIENFDITNNYLIKQMNQEIDTFF